MHRMKGRGPATLDYGTTKTEGSTGVNGSAETYEPTKALNFRWHTLTLIALYTSL